MPKLELRHKQVAALRELLVNRRGWDSDDPKRWRGGLPSQTLAVMESLVRRGLVVEKRGVYKVPMANMKRVAAELAAAEGPDDAS